MNLESLLFPIGLEEFNRTYWSKQFLRIARDNTKYYNDMFSEVDMENTLYIASRFPGAVQEIAEDTVIRTIHTPEDAVNTFNAKRSLRINAIQRFSITLEKLTRNLAKVISSPININLYMSPFSGQKALPRHYDLHDVIVLQISGRKKWKIFEPRVELPLETLPRLQYETNDDVRRFRVQELGGGRDCVEMASEFVVEPGDLLYLPRGFYHEALTDNDAGASCHLTIGVKPTTYLDLFALALADAAYADPRLRGHLPLGLAKSAPLQSEAIRAFNEISRDLPTHFNSNKALSKYIGLLHRAHKGSLQNQLFSRQATATDINALTIDSRLGVRDGTLLGLDYSSSPVHLCFGENRFAIEDDYIEACQFLCDNSDFSSSMLPGPLTAQQKLTLLRQLMVENIVFMREQSHAAA
ncbi:JmjC domain-containing protein [Dyella nitratireducens]|uniref:JmjC domain-containing protein n=1 Tax=Dyella nitratireducens TaxID=1849580 RepID=A0ABQ1GC98_9GAMM|nr:cupin domain-containing protein [Dyella nitratireducens]GGA40707.1 hypothetical protein GCM10010981_32400 [Dyella nitratireducens]GLQ40598.1 hypothetical protein GCM10007902_04470 [Dyella nitratireducens]